MAAKRVRQPKIHLPILTRFQVGKHVVEVSRNEERWAVSVNAVALPTWFMTQVEAWEAGVREADRLDRLGTHG